MFQWFMVTLVGKDQIGIVAQVTTALYQGGCHLGEASMSLLGGSFTIMLMVSHSGDLDSLETLLKPVATTLNLHVHIDTVTQQSSQSQRPDVRISVHGADRAGIVAEVTTALSAAGLNILNLESDVGGQTAKPFYVMSIEGVATLGIEVLEKALQHLLASQPDLGVKMEPIDTMVV